MGELRRWSAIEVERTIVERTLLAVLARAEYRDLMPEPALGALLPAEDLKRLPRAGQREPEVKAAGAEQRHPLLVGIVRGILEVDPVAAPFDDDRARLERGRRPSNLAVGTQVVHVERVEHPTRHHGFPGEERLRRVAREAGFSNLRRAAQTPVNLILELSP